MTKTYGYTDQRGNTITLRFARGEYEAGGGLYVECHCLNVEDDGEEWWEAYAPITVNLGTGDESPFAYADYNNSGDLIRWLVDNGNAVFTGDTLPCGFCLYPKVKFAEEFLGGMPFLQDVWGK